jgi:exopolysaccharide biosynthesis protein
LSAKCCLKNGFQVFLAIALCSWLNFSTVEARPKAQGKTRSHVTAAKHHKTASRNKKPAARRVIAKHTAVKHAKKTAAKARPSIKPAIVPPIEQQVSSGVQYRRFTQRISGGPVRISVLEIDPQISGIEITPALASGRMGSKTNVANMVNQHQAVAGINGSFFKPDVGIPLGILMINQELISGPIYDRVALGITKDNGLVMDRIHLAGEIVLPSGRRLPLQNVNQPRVNANHTVLYSARWGAHAPRVPSNGVQVLLRNNRVAAVSTTQPLDITTDGMVVSGSYSPEMAELASLPANKQVQVNVYTLPDWSGMKHAIGGGPWLVRNGLTYIDLRDEHFSSRGLGYREPRSAVGITQSGKMLLVAVDGRQTGSIGMTLPELATLMRQLGAIQAMNLDGGSSTQMAVHGKTVNAPSSGQIGVSNSLLIRQVNNDNMALQEARKTF